MTDSEKVWKIPVPQWQVVDSVLANSYSSLIDNRLKSDDQEARLLWQVRQSTSGQIPWVSGNQWPEREKSLVLSLSASSWKLVWQTVDAYALLLERIGEAEEAQIVRDSLASIPPTSS